MIDFTIETDIARTEADVFAYATDPKKLSSWQTNTVAVTQEGEGPLKLGTRLREVHRTPLGQELASLVEVSELDPPRGFALRMIDGQLPIHAEMSFTSNGEGTRMLFRAYGQPTGPTRFLQPALRIVLKRQFLGYCKTLKRILETPEQSGPEPRS